MILSIHHRRAICGSRRLGAKPAVSGDIRRHLVGTLLHHNSDRFLEGVPAEAAEVAR